MAGTQPKSDPVASALAAFEAEVTAAPARHGFVPRLARKGQVLTTEPDAMGNAITLQADTHGIVRPESPEQVQAADALGLPSIQTKE